MINIWGQVVNVTPKQRQELRTINYYGKVTVHWTEKRLLRTYKCLADKGLIQVDWVDRCAIRYKRV